MQFKESSEGGYTFECQHGPTECLGNTVHACAARHVNSPSVLMEYVRCMMADNYVPMDAGARCAGEVREGGE